MGGGRVQLDLVLLDSLDRSPSRLHADKQRLWSCLMLALDSLRWKLHAAHRSPDFSAGSPFMKGSAWLLRLPWKVPTVSPCQ